MTPLSKLVNRLALQRELPSVLAIPLSDMPGSLEADPSTAFRKGLDLFQTSLRFITLVAVADVFRKVQERSPWAQRSTVVDLLPSVAKILEPKTPHGKWIECCRDLMSAYDRHPEWFFVPELLANRSRLNDVLGRLGNIRNVDYAHGHTHDPDPVAVRAIWAEMDPLLGELVGLLEPLQRYHLLQLKGTYVGAPRDGRWYRFNPDGVYRLRGDNTRRSYVDSNKPWELCFTREVPRFNQLYLFKPDCSGNLSLHPFVLYPRGNDLFSNVKSASDVPFLFNELKAQSLSYLPIGPGEGITFRKVQEPGSGTDEQDTAGGPVYQYFSTLRAVVGATDVETLEVLPGFGRRSPVLSFESTLAYHTGNFAGREEEIGKIEDAFAGRFRCAWIAGGPGLGKTALMAQLAQLPGLRKKGCDPIVYFISPEKQTADATVFLRHASQYLLDRLNLSSDAAPVERKSRDELGKLFKDLLKRAGEALQGRSEKLAILIDGLDESDRYASDPQEVIRKYLPAAGDEIPEGIFLIVSSRPDEVDMGDLADVPIHLKPFTQAEVARILKHSRWDEEQARIAYDLSEGEPIYFPFLLDGIQKGTLKAKNARHLPKGVRGFYERFWEDCSRAKRERDEARLGEIQQHILGFLAAASEPLSRSDLERLVRVLAPGVRQDLGANGQGGLLGEVSLALSRLGRFVVGGSRFSLFHDTLREFVLQKTREPDSAPPGEAKRYHEALAAVCRQHKSYGSSYGDQHLVRHLLGSRQYGEVLDWLEQQARSGMLASKLADPFQVGGVLRDLGFARQAASELNDLPGVFRYTVLRLLASHVRGTGVVPSAASLLLRTGDDGLLAEMLDACEEEKRAEFAGEVWAQAVRMKDSRAAAWYGRLKGIVAAGATGSRYDLQRTLERLYAPEPSQVADALLLYPSMDEEQSVEAVIRGLWRNPVVAAEFVCARGWKRGDQQLVGLAARLAAMGQRGLTAGILPEHLELRFGSDETIASLAALEHAMPGASPSIRLGDIDRWSDVAKVLLLSGALAPAGGLVAKTSDGDAALLELAWKAARRRDPAAYADAESKLRQDGASQLHALLGAITLLILAGQRLKDPAAAEWEGMLLGALAESCRGDAITDKEAQELFEGEDPEEELKRRLPRARSLLREASGIFSNPHDAFFFSVLVSSPSAADALLGRKVRAWLRGLERRDVTHETGEQFGVSRGKLAELLAMHLGRGGDRGDVQELVLPVYLALAAGAEPRGRVRAMMPLEPLATVRTFLNPDLPAAFIGMLLPWMVDSDGDPIGGNEMVSDLFGMVAYEDPDLALARWRELGRVDVELVRSERARLGLHTHGEATADTAAYQDFGEVAATAGGGSDMGSEGSAAAPASRDEAAVGVGRSLARFFSRDDHGQPEHLGAEPIIGGLAAVGRWDEALDLGARTTVPWGFLTNLPVNVQPVAEGFLRRLPECADRWPQHAEILQGLTEDALSALAEPSRGDEFRRLLASPKAVNWARRTLSRWAFEHGQGQAVIDSLRAALQDKGAARPDDNQVEAVALAWAEHASSKRPDAAREMWKAIRAFRTSRGLEAFDLGRYAFESKLVDLIDAGRVQAEDLAALGARIDPSLVRARVALAAAMVRAGWERAAIAPMLQLPGMAAVLGMLERLRGLPVPPWLLTHLHERALQHVDAVAVGRDPGWSDVAECLQLACADAWSQDERVTLLARADEALTRLSSALPKEAGGAAKQAEEGLLLLGAFAGRVERDALGSAAAEEKSRLPFLMSMLAEWDPRTTWLLASAIPNPEIRDSVKAQAFRAALKRDPSWAVEAFADWAKPATAGKLIEAAVRVSENSWPDVAPMVAEAVANLPDGLELDTEVLARLAGRSAELCAKVLRRAPSPLAWADLFSRDDLAPAVALELATPECARWRRTLEDGAGEVWDDEYAAGRTVDMLLGRIVALPDADDRRRVAEQLLDGIESVLRTKKHLRDRILDDALKHLTKLDPARGLRWIREFRFKEYSLADRLTELLSGAPVLAETRDATEALNLLDKSDRKALIRKVLARGELSRAIGAAKREGIEVQDLALEVARARELQDDEIGELERLAGADQSLRFEMMTSALARAGKAGRGRLKAWEEAVWSAFQKGEFHFNPEWKKLEFRLQASRAGSSRGFTRREPAECLPVVYALKPLEMEKVFRRLLSIAAEGPTETAAAHRMAFDEIRGRALPHCVRLSPDWVLAHLDSLALQAWWPRFGNRFGSEEDVVAAAKELEPVGAIRLLGALDKLDTAGDVLANVHDPSLLRRCLTALAAGLSVGHVMERGVDLCLEHAGRAGLDPVTLAVDLALGLKEARSAIGLGAGDAQALLVELEAIAAGAEKPASPLSRDGEAGRSEAGRSRKEAIEEAKALLLAAVVEDAPPSEIERRHAELQRLMQIEGV